MSVDLDQFNDSNMGMNDMDMSSNQAEKRAHHNALERKRRDHIKGSFHDLRDVVPIIKGEKASRAHVLKSATDYIQSLRSKNRESQKTIENLKQQNARLEMQTRLLERLKDTSLYTQKQEPVVQVDSDIQTTRNLLN